MTDPIGNITVKVAIKDAAGDALVGADATIKPKPTNGDGTGTTNKDGVANISANRQPYTAGGSLRGYSSNSGFPVVNGEATVTLSVPSGSGTLKITVNNSTGGAIAEATVTVTSTISQKTNSDGVAALGLVAGPYTNITASAAGYTTSTAISKSVTDGGTTLHTITLAAAS